MESIGNVFLKLGVNGEDFTAGLNKAGGQLRSFQTTVEAYKFSGGAVMQRAALELNNVFGSMGSHFGNLSGAFQSVQSWVGALSQAKDGWSAVGIVATKAVSEVAQATIAAAEETHEWKLEAEKLGISLKAVQELRAASRVSGVDEGTAEQGMERLLGGLGAARMGDKGKTDAFAGLGLDVERLAALQPDQLLIRVAQAMESIQDKSVKARMEMELFGRSGPELDNLLKTVSNGLGQFQNKAQSDKASAAFIYLHRGLKDLNSDFGQMGTSVKNWWGETLAVLAGLSDEKVRAAIKVPESKPLSKHDLNIQAIKDELKEARKVLGDINKTPVQLKLDKAAAKGMDDYELGLLREALEEEEGITMQKKHQEELARSMQQWHESAVRAAMSELDIRKEIAKEHGATKTQMDQIGKDYGTEQQAKERQKLLDSGKQLAASLMSPFEKLQKAMADIGRLRSVGALNDTMASRAALKARDEFMQAAPQPQLAAAMEQGSKEAYSAAVKYQLGQQADKLADEANNVIIKQLPELVETMKQQERFRIAEVP